MTEPTPVDSKPVETEVVSTIKPYRGMTPEEDAWTNPKTPRKFDRRVRVSCPSGDVAQTAIAFEDGEPLRNVLRVAIALESPQVKGANGQQPDGKAYVFVSQFANEIGRVVYGVAEALVGDG